MKFLKPLLGKVGGLITRFITWVKERGDKIIADSKKKSSGKFGWVKPTLLLLGMVGLALIVVAVVSAFVLFCLAVPGLIFGTILWLVWTWAGLGAQLFPNLEAHWLSLTWQQFFWIVTGIYWLQRMFRKGKQPPILNNRDS